VCGDGGHEGAGRCQQSSPYNDRREACARAAAQLGVSTLRDAQLDEIAALPDDLRRRARHVVTENTRTLEGAEALRAGDVAAFGALMNESHASLRDDFEVCPRGLDALAAAVRDVDACYGARLTGAGFGGCVVALVDKDGVEGVRRAVRELRATVYEYEATAGVSYLHAYDDQEAS
jgi:galactokinase